MALSTEVLRKTAQRVEKQFPLIGCGGVGSGADAYAKIRAGATLVQLYSMLVYEGPPLVRRIKDELAALLARDGFASVADAVGADCSDSFPQAQWREAQAGSRAGRRAVARRVVHPLQVEMLERAGGANPVADLGVSRVELLARQGLQGAGVLLAERANDLAVEAPRRW